MILLIFFSIFWLFAFIRKLLFWVYLWQLKEYHIGRFVDHFRTYKGKKIFLNYFLLAKILALVGIIIFARIGLAGLKFACVYLAAALLLMEALYFLRNVRQKTFKSPVLTRKTSLILTTGLSLELLILSFVFVVVMGKTRAMAGLLLLDILAPLVFSALVLAFQPLTVVLRERIIARAKKRREQFKDLLVIGITGSYGKTSTKEFLATVLAKKYKVLKTKEHLNSEIGVSLAILDDLKEEHEVFVCEMGAYHKKGIKLLAEIAQPKIGILTGVNEQHLATFGSLQNTLRTKFELIESLPEDGVAILNYSDTRVKKEKIEDYNHKLKNIKTYAINQRADVWTEDIKMETDKISFKIRSQDGEEVSLSLNLIGLHNVHNLLGAACCAKNLGMSLAEITSAFQEIEAWQSGVQLKKGVNDLNIVDATYSANPDGVLSHLDYLKVWDGKKVIVMPCLIELGKASKEIHQKIGQKIGEVCDLAIITTKDRFKDIQTGAPNALFMEKPAEIVEKIKEFCHPGDVVLLESRLPAQVSEQLIWQLKK